MSSAYNNDGFFLKVYEDRVNELLKEKGYILLSEVYDILGVSWRRSLHRGSPELVIALDPDKYGIEGWHYFQDLPSELRKKLFRDIYGIDYVELF